MDAMLGGPQETILKFTDHVLGSQDTSGQVRDGKSLLRLCKVGALVFVFVFL